MSIYVELVHYLIRTQGDNNLNFIMAKKSLESEKVSIKLRAYEAALVDQAAIRLVQTIKAIGGTYSGPVPLPTKYEEFTILRSVHINKKSREQFERRTHKRLVVLTNPSKALLDQLSRLEFSAGVNVEIKVIKK